MLTGLALEKGLLANIWKLKVLRALRFLLFVLPVLIPFFQDRGLSVGEIVYLQAIFGIWVVVLEVPTGYISDRYSRKLSLQLGFLVTCVSYLMYLFGGGFGYFVFVYFLMGMGTSLVSGSNDALLYDSLLSLGKSHEYVKHKSHVSGVSSLAESVAGIVGGFLAVLGFQYVIIAQACSVFLGFILSLTLAEPPIHKEQVVTHKEEILNVFRQIWFKNKIVKWCILYAAFLGAMTFGSVWFFQPVLVENNVDIALFGFAWALMNLSVGLCVYFVPWFQKNFKLRSLLFLMPVVCAFSYLLIGWWLSLWSLIFYIGISWVRAVKGVLVSHLLNENISSQNRATILSINSMMFRIVYGIMGPMMGFVADLISLQTAFLATGLIFMILCLGPMYKLRKLHAL